MYLIIFLRKKENREIRNILFLVPGSNVESK